MEKIVEEKSKMAKRNKMGGEIIILKGQDQAGGSQKVSQRHLSTKKLTRDRHELDLFNVNTYNRNGITHRQHINILALPKMERTRPQREKKVKQPRDYSEASIDSAHLNSLAQPRNHYLLHTMRDHKEILSMSRLGSIIKQLSSNKALTPRQAAKQYEDLIKLKQKQKSPIKTRKARIQPTLKYNPEK